MRPFNGSVYCLILHTSIGRQRVTAKVIRVGKFRSLVEYGVDDLDAGNSYIKLKKVRNGRLFSRII